MATTKKDILTHTTFDLLTGVETVRELTNDELLEREALAAADLAEIAAIEAKAIARESALAKLAALGLTADEIGAL